MTYLDSEVSVHDGKPIELYKFEGTYENYYYTSAARKITYAGNDYLPIPLQRTEIAAGTENDDGLNITIDLPVTAGLIAVYGFEDAPPALDLTIYRYHEVGAVIPYWIGPVVSISTNDGIGTVQSDSELATLLSEDFPNVYYQGPCNFVLFDQRCKVIEANYSGSAVLGVVNGRTISVDAIPSGATAIPLDGKLVGGEVKLSSGERRMIIAQAGVVITLNFAFSRTTIGDEITITAGCDHAYLGDCKTKFNNQQNNGGFPFIGTDNPFVDGVQDGSTLPDVTCLEPAFDGVWLRVVFTAVEACNPCWTGNRVVTIPAIKPNGIHGQSIHIVEDDGGGCDYYESNIYEINDPATDPRLKGQLLVKFVSRSFLDWEVRYYFEGAGTPTASVFPAARFCGSVGKDHGMGSVTYKYYNSGPVAYGSEYMAGNSESDWG